jgi:signal transduction histidine kinase
MAAMIARITHTQLLRYAGLFTWVCAGIPLVLEPWYFDESGGIGRFDLFAWRLSYFGFGFCYWTITRRLGRRVNQPFDIALLAILTGSAIGVSHFSSSGLGGILLLIIAGVLPWVLNLRIGVAWLILQHVALAPVFASRPEFSLFDAVLQAMLYVGFSSFVFVTSVVARQQAEAREEQRRLNAELRATRALLAESSRLNERMRISRELHDLLGHHLTALSLNLEVASHVTSGKGQEHVRQAQSLAKLLLTDVREAVSQLRQDQAIELGTALRSLIEGVPGLRIELDMPPDFSVDDPQRAQVILRCAQEILTNTVRHAQASRLCLRFAADAGGIAIHAEDNGRGADAAQAGNGLRGMRERLAQFGGRLDIRTAKGQGFALDAFLPLENPA